MKFKNCFIVITLLGLGGLGAFWLWSKTDKDSSAGQLKPYFSYSQAEVDSLSKESSALVVTNTDLQAWDKKMFAGVKQALLGDAYAARVYAYLYTAQNDAMALSELAQGKSLVGSIAPVSAQVLCRLLPKSCDGLKNPISDAYSEHLARIVIAKVDERIAEDAKPEHNKLMPQKVGGEYWLGVRPFYAQEVASWKPWRMRSGDQFIVPAPRGYPDLNNSFWKNQLQMTLDARKQATDEQKAATVFWAGGPGTVTPPGQWLLYGNQYMWRSEVPLARAILIRMVLSQGLVDTCIGVFNSKYTYWAPRPFMRDHTLTTIMPTPNHPSYPAGHSTISSGSETILSFFFPEKQAFWAKLSTEAGSSRIWSGIHFTIDNEEGVKLGRKIGEAALVEVR